MHSGRCSRRPEYLLSQGRESGVLPPDSSPHPKKADSRSRRPGSTRPRAPETPLSPRSFLLIVFRRAPPGLPHKASIDDRIRACLSRLRAPLGLALFVRGAHLRSGSAVLPRRFHLVLRSVLSRSSGNPFGAGRTLVALRFFGQVPEAVQEECRHIADP